MSISEIMRVSRGDKSLREFAADLGISHQTVANWEDGSRKPTFELLMEVFRSGNKELAVALWVAMRPGAEQAPGNGGERAQGE